MHALLAISQDQYKKENNMPDQFDKVIQSVRNALNDPSYDGRDIDRALAKHYDGEDTTEFFHICACYIKDEYVRNLARFLWFVYRSSADELVIFISKYLAPDAPIRRKPYRGWRR